jgi:hypothetical protein
MKKIRKNKKIKKNKKQLKKNKKNNKKKIGLSKDFFFFIFFKLFLLVALPVGALLDSALVLT